MSSAISQLSCFSSIFNGRRLHLSYRSNHCAAKIHHGKVLSVINGDGHGAKISHLENKTNNPSYVEDSSTSHNGNSVKSHPVADGFVPINGQIEEQVIDQPKRAAKIHDFCFGIPFGGLVLSGGLVGFIFSRSPAALGSGVLFGGALLALSTLSLKVWRRGKSSFPFILGQAVISVALLSKNFQAYSLTKKLFPTGLNIIICAAMLCFYAYVVISGGNPPPKKLKPSTAVESS